jgi:hypothetical protein
MAERGHDSNPPVRTRSCEMTDRFRRVSLIPVRPGEGRLTEPTTAVQTWRPELVFMSHTGDCPGLVGALRPEKNGHSL